MEDKTEGEIPEKVFIEFVRNDKSWSTGKSEIDKNGDVINVKLSSSTSICLIFSFIMNKETF
ncbi:MAG: hypothetical protein Q9M91_06775 [Candidatus Dojkabacteria bacterium]|nr:hypothetical protein [Candidatus Dojkabacteria bacterium]